MQVPILTTEPMVTEPTILKLVQHIAEHFAPERILLFGSYAYGSPRPESDVDLLVVMDTPLDEYEQTVSIRKTIRNRFPLDLIVRTPAELARRIELGDFFLQEVTQKGKILYERINTRSIGLS